MFFVKVKHKDPEGIALRAAICFQRQSMLPDDEYEEHSAKDYNVEMWMLDKIKIYSASDYEKMERTKGDYVR